MLSMAAAEAAASEEKAAMAGTPAAEAVVLLAPVRMRATIRVIRVELADQGFWGLVELVGN